MQRTLIMKSYNRSGECVAPSVPFFRNLYDHVFHVAQRLVVLIANQTVCGIYPNGGGGDTPPWLFDNRGKIETRLVYKDNTENWDTREPFFEII